MKQRFVIKVYVGESRPSHDSAPLGTAPMTDDERRTLNDMIARYLNKCRIRASKDPKWKDLSLLPTGA